MKDLTKKYEKKLGRVRRFLEGIEWMFDLSNYQRNLRVMDHDHDEYSGMAAEVTYDEKYQSIVVTMYPNFFSLSLHSQRKALLHELCHAITIPSQQVAMNLLRGTATTENRIRDINEQTTSRIENLLNGLLTGRYRYARNAYAEYVAPPKKRRKRR